MIKTLHGLKYGHKIPTRGSVLHHDALSSAAKLWSRRMDFLSAPLCFKVLENIHCSKDLEERHTILFIYDNVIPKFNPHLKAIHKGPE